MNVFMHELQNSVGVSKLLNFDKSLITRGNLSLIELSGCLDFFVDKIFGANWIFDWFDDTRGRFHNWDYNFVNSMWGSAPPTPWCFPNNFSFLRVLVVLINKIKIESPRNFHSRQFRWSSTQKSTTIKEMFTPT